MERPLAQFSFAAVEDKVVDQVPVPVQCLSTYSCWSPGDIRDLELRYVPLELLHLRPDEDTSVEFLASIGQVLAKEFLETPELQCVPQLGQVDVEVAIPLPTKREDRVGSQEHVPIHSGCVVDAQERKPWIGDRINVPSYQVGLLGVQEQVLSPKGKDLGLWIASRQGSQLVSVWPRILTG